MSTSDEFIPDNYLVIVGNIGTVYDGQDTITAERAYQDYVTLSQSDYGRAAGEDVTLMVNGEVEREHYGHASA